MIWHTMCSAGFLNIMSDITCPVCLIDVLDSENGIACERLCKRWFHADCVRMSRSEYAKYANDSKKKWFCNRADCTPKDENPLTKLSNQLAGLIQSVSQLATKDEVNSINNGIEKLRESIETRLTNVESRVEDLENKVKSLEKDDVSSECRIEELMGEIGDRNRRALNVVFNLPESCSKDLSVRISHDKGQLTELGQDIGLALDVSNVRLFRVGRPRTNGVRPLKIVFQSVAGVKSFLDKFSEAKLRGSNSKFSSVSASRDRTEQERSYLNSLRTKLDQRIKNGERDLTIRYRNGIPAIVTSSKND